MQFVLTHVYIGENIYSGNFGVRVSYNEQPLMVFKPSGDSYYVVHLAYECHSVRGAIYRTLCTRIIDRCSTLVSEQRQLPKCINRADCIIDINYRLLNYNQLCDIVLDTIRGNCRTNIASDGSQYHDIKFVDIDKETIESVKKQLRQRCRGAADAKNESSSNHTEIIGVIDFNGTPRAAFSDEQRPTIFVDVNLVPRFVAPKE